MVKQAFAQSKVGGSSAATGSQQIPCQLQIYSGEFLLGPVRGPDVVVAADLSPGGLDARLSSDGRRRNRTPQLVGADDDDAGQPRDDVARNSTSCKCFSCC